MNKIKIKFLKSFISPLSNRREKPGTVLNVPESQFWLKRLEQNDVEKIKAEAKKAKKASAEVKNKKEGK